MTPRDKSPLKGGEGILPKFTRRISFVTRYIQDHYQSALSLKQISFLISIRSDMLSRQFKKETGVGFLDFINKMRIGRAKALLRNPGRRIKEISYSVGFNSPEAFCKVFKKITKLSPRAYRKRRFN